MLIQAYAISYFWSIVLVMHMNTNPIVFMNSNQVESGGNGPRC